MTPNGFYKEIIHKTVCIHRQTTCPEALRWDSSEIQSMSEGSTMMPDSYGRKMRRVLDSKVRKLRSLTADEDITTELDRIVCRLMQLALRTSKKRQTPPPASWMQRKLLDLLSLTERAIERRRRHFIESYPLKAIGYDHFDCMKTHLGVAETLNRIRNDDTVDKIADKYMMQSSDPDTEKFVVKSEVHYTEENLSDTSNEMETCALERKSVYGEVRLESIKSSSKEKIHLEITQAWVDEDFDMAPAVEDYVKPNVASSDYNTSIDQFRDGKGHKKCQNVERQHDVGLNVSSKHKPGKISKTSKIKGRQSKNKLIKKVSKKHCNTGQFVQNYSEKIKFVEYKSYTFNKQNKIYKEHHNLQSTLSKPIPRSLIELCYQDLSAVKNDKLLESSIRNEFKNISDSCDNIAATKESFFIDLVSENTVETLALRRTTATEADQNSDNMETEAILETVINVTRDESFDDNQMDPLDTAHSETIFLYDLNEPTTSKGIRHVSADAQCGTDIKNVDPTPSSITTVINLPNKCETGIRIGDSFTNLRYCKNSVDFGTITDHNTFYYEFSSAITTNTLKIKDSDTKISRKVESSTMTPDNDMKLDTDTRSLGQMSNVLSSKLHFSNINPSKSGLRCLKHPSDIGISQIVSVTKYLRPKLSYCGIHVHSYRDRQVTEDIVFQGQWQRKRPTILSRKMPCSQLTLRKHETTVKRKKLDSKETDLSSKLDEKVIKHLERKDVNKWNVKYPKLKQNLVTKDDKKSHITTVHSLTKNSRNTKNMKKVASKIVESLITTSSGKNGCAARNKFVFKSTTSKVNDRGKMNKKDELSYLNNNNKRNLVSRVSNTINKSAEHPITPVKLSPPLNKSKTATEGLTDNLLKFSRKKQKNMTYLVFRNEIENSRSLNSSSAKPVIKINSSKNNYNPPSQNSSSSSPNSIATVRALSTNTFNKNSSTSPTRHNLGNMYKHPKNIKSLSANKENLPETSKKYDIHKKDSDKSQTIFNDRNKNLYMLQMKTESPPLITSKKSENITNPLNSSNTRLLRNKNTEDKDKVISSSSLKSSPNRKCKSPVRYHNERDKHDTLNTYDDCPVPELSHLTRSSTPILELTENNIDIQEGINAEEINSTNTIKRSKSKINAAMKQLIEERLSFIKRIQDNNNSDSETVILSRDDQYECEKDNSSPVSYKTVITNENTCNISSRDLENALINYSFESNVESLGTLDSTQWKLSGTDYDLFTESMTHSSELIIGQNELDKTLVPHVNSNTKTVRDIFERKDQPVLNTGGVIAVQVFSGFSVNGEPVVGDQPDYISLVDPETGHLVSEHARQATSEEIFVSGRSSDTYESCCVDDDAYVPNWLFHVISQQQSLEVPDEEQEPESDDVSGEPEYDVNNNAMEGGFGVGVGAGDGRGMHSDQSQDSSGRGTSISSSDVSSEPQSEAILIDPSSFLGPGGSAALMLGATAMPLVSSDTSFRTVENTETDNETRCSRDVTQRRLGRVPLATDADADVSSLGTDAADSDN